MNLYKAFLSMVLIGMAFGQDVEGGGEVENIDMISIEETNEDPQEIVGGELLSQKDRAKRPFLVNLGWFNPILAPLDEYRCAGSLISPRSILTAAHCMWDSPSAANGWVWTWNPPDFIDFFRYDVTDAVGTGGSVRMLLALNACVPHPGYQPGSLVKMDDDVAICILSTQAPAGATPITLNSNPSVPAPNAPLDVAGWGVRFEDDHPPGNWQMDTTVPFVTTLNYIAPLTCPTPHTATEMCTNAPGTAECHGDSGTNAFLFRCSVLHSLLTWQATLFTF
ncbi:hypothetical protein ACHAXN_010106 [Cyclotella atomus]|jgi:secreted trypsin-like serine protease